MLPLPVRREARPRTLVRVRPVLAVHVGLALREIRSVGPVHRAGEEERRSVGSARLDQLQHGGQDPPLLDSLAGPFEHVEDEERRLVAIQTLQHVPPVCPLPAGDADRRRGAATELPHAPVPPRSVTLPPGDAPFPSALLPPRRSRDETQSFLSPAGPPAKFHQPPLPSDERPPPAPTPRAGAPALRASESTGGTAWCNGALSGPRVPPFKWVRKTAKPAVATSPIRNMGALASVSTGARELA